MTNLETYIHELEKGRAEMREVITHINENQLIYEPWRVKEVIDHITGWDDAIIASINSLLQGDTPATPAARGLNVYNAETVSTREALPYAHSLREWEASRVELLRLLHLMSEEQLTQPFTLPWGGEGNIGLVVSIFCEHEIEHAEDIRKQAMEGQIASEEN
ncbi:MAG TPA: DinB family protein [Anaerolineales bacterium]|nr:DinB family protein [Anaerolineales bacterium]